VDHPAKRAPPSPSPRHGEVSRQQLLLHHQGRHLQVRCLHDPRPVSPAALASHLVRAGSENFESILDRSSLETVIHCAFTAIPSLCFVSDSLCTVWRFTVWNNPILMSGLIANWLQSFAFARYWPLLCRLAKSKRKPSLFS
jgi:hypothetical protein